MAKNNKNQNFISDEEMAKLEASSSPDFISDEEMDALETSATEEPSVVAPYVAKLAQGMSAGLSDEFSGALEAGGRVFGVKGAGGPIKDIDLVAPTLNIDELKQSYQQARDIEREKLTQYEDLPLSSTTEFIGSVISPFNKIGKGLSMTKQAAIIGGLTGLGKSESETVSGDVVSTALGAGIGAGLGKVASKLSDKFINKASDLAENAIGATGLQAEKFQEGTGKKLLEMGVVNYLDNPESIAAKSDVVIKQAERTIDKTLKALDNKGVTVDVNKIVQELEIKSQQMSTNPALEPVVKKLNNMIDAIYKAGQSKIPVSEAEIVKRTYNNVAKDMWLKPSKGQAAKMAYIAYRDAVEEASKVIDPDLAKEFIGAKKVYALLNPVRQFAQRRALTLNQSPVGGLLDVATAGASAAAGNTSAAGQVAAAAARRAISPRISSTVAAGLYDVGQGLSGKSAASNILLNPSTMEFSQKKLTPSFVESYVNQKNPDRTPQGQADVANVMQTMHPYDREQYIKKDNSLSPTERAILLKQNRNAR